MSEGTKKGPVYRGITKHVDKEGGYAVWLPSPWRKIDMVDDHHGWIFTPYPDRYDTCFVCEKKVLDFKVKPEDLDLLVEGFEAGILSLQDVEMLEKKHEAGKMVVILEAKFTFTENGQRRKRWVKSMYWAEANLVLMAQGANEEEYAYWEPMLFNAMYSYELGAY
jgi:hypothetical protein